MKLKTDWKMNDIIKPKDFNDIGEAVNGLGEELAKKVDRTTSNVFALPLAENYVTLGFSGYYKNDAGVVSLSLHVQNDGEKIVSNIAYTIGYLPVGYRPKVAIVGTGIYHAFGEISPIFMTIDIDGRIIINAHKVLQTGRPDVFAGAFCFVSTQ